MDLNKNGKLFADLRKVKGLTQKQVADTLGITPKTVSKWETGKGFPDVSTVTALSDIYGVSERTLLSGNLGRNNKDAGNMKKTRFYVCHDCGSFMQGIGANSVICCGKAVEKIKPKAIDDMHKVNVLEIDNDFFIEFNHEMTKEHYISFASCVGFDRVITVRLYPEQASSVRIPRMFRGKLYFYCTKHGLFEYRI